MKLRKYMVYLDDGKNVFKCAIPAQNEEKAKEYASGNGEIIAVKDVTDEFSISLVRVENALDGLDKFEKDFILRALELINLFDE